MISVVMMFGFLCSLSCCAYAVCYKFPICMKNKYHSFSKVRSNEGTIKAVEDVKKQAFKQARPTDRARCWGQSDTEQSDLEDCRE